MNVTIQVQHSKEFGDVSKGKTYVLASLLEIDTLKIKIETVDNMIYWLDYFIKELKEKIGFNEASALAQFNPVLQVAVDFKCENSKEIKNHKMEALLINIYGLKDKQIQELAQDLFVSLYDKWLEFYTNCNKEEHE